MLTKKEHTELKGDYISYSTETRQEYVVRISTKRDYNNPNMCISLPEARAIHAELTELFTLLDEKV